MEKKNENSNNELQKLRKELQLLKDELSVGYFLSEIITDENYKPKDFRIIECNDLAAESFGVNKDDMIGKSSKELFPDLESKWIKIFGEIAQKGGSISFENNLGFGSKYFSGRAYSSETEKFAITFSEITHRKQNEITIRESEDRYRRLVEKLPDIVYMYSNKSGGIYYSPSIKDILGYSPEYLIENPFLYQNLIHPDDIEIVFKTIKQFENNDSFDIEYRIKDSDGSWHWFRDRLIRKIETDGDIIVEGLAADISDYKELFKKIDKEKENIESVFNAIPAFLFTQNLEHDVLFANDNFISLFGEPANRKCYEILHERNQPCEDCCSDKTPIKDSYCSKEVKLNNGKYYLISDSLIKTANGETQILETGFDISLWKKDQEVYLENERKFRNIFENAPVGIFRSTSEGRFIDVNPKLAGMLGYDSPQDAIDSIKDIAKDVYIKTNLRNKIIDESDSHNSFTNFENVYRRKDGNTFIANLYLKTHKDKDGNIDFLEGMVEDITLRKRIEEELRVSQKNFKIVIANLPYAVFAHTLDGKFILVNKKSETNTGYTEEELLRMQVGQIDPSVVTRNDREKIWHSLKPGEFVQIESEHTRKDGSIYPAEITISAIELKGKKVLLAIAQDISKRKEALQSLEESERRFRKFFEEDKTVKLIINPESGNIIDANPAAKEFYGYSNLKEMRIQDINQLNEGEVKSRMDDASQSSVNYFFFKHKLSSGEIRDVEVFSTPMNIKGKTLLFSLIIDITERKEAEKAILESEEKFRQFFVHSNDGITITNEEGNIEEWNETMEKITGIDKKDALGKKIYDVQVSIADYYKDKPEAINQLIESIEQFFITGDAPWLNQLTETEVETNDGKNKIMQSRIFGYKTYKGYKAASIVRDVTEIKKIEQELKEALETKDRFFSIIAHDLRSPLSGFIQLSKELAEDYANMTFEDINICANSLYESSNFLYSLLDNLLEWSRLQRKHNLFKPEELNLNETVNSCINLLKVFAKGKNIRIMNNTDPEIIVFADKNMLKTVLRNLLSNALKFSFQYSEINVSSNISEKNEVVVSVADQGNGISDKVRSTLFSLGDKNIENGTENEKGTGLGLILCKEYIENNGGKIWFESDLKQGTTFYFTLQSS